MSTSIPRRQRNGAINSLRSSITAICSRSRSAVSPRATVSRGEWSVIAQYSWPSAWAVSIISSSGLPPSDQVEWQCRSPLTAARMPSPPAVSGSFSSRNFCR